MGLNKENKHPDIQDISESDAFFYENGFYLTSHQSRLSKLLVHYELFKKIIHTPGDIVECGVFKGASLSRFAKLRNIFCNPEKRRLIGFDTFGEFPIPDNNQIKGDVESRAQFVKESGDTSISKDKLTYFLKGCKTDENVFLIEGDVSDTLPIYVRDNPDLRIALLNIDVDLYKPTFDCLRFLYDKVTKGGVVILDDYRGFPGATKAVDDFFSDKPNIRVDKMFWSDGPFFLVKE